MDTTRLSPPLKFRRFGTRQHALALNGLSRFRAHNRVVPGSNPGGPNEFSPAMPRASAPLSRPPRASERIAGTRMGQTDRDFRLELVLLVARAEAWMART